MSDFDNAVRGRGSAVDYHATLRVIPHLRRFAFVFTHDLDTADDLVETVLRRAIAERTRIPDGTEWRLWLFMVMHGVLADRRRQEAPIKSTEKTVSENSSELEAGLRTLPFEQRVTLLLVALEELSYKEIAEITGVGVETVRSRLSRARESLALKKSQKAKGAEIEGAAYDDRTGGAERLSGSRPGS